MQTTNHVTNGEDLQRLICGDDVGSEELASFYATKRGLIRRALERLDARCWLGLIRKLFRFQCRIIAIARSEKETKFEPAPPLPFQAHKLSQELSDGGRNPQAVLVAFCRPDPLHHGSYPPSRPSAWQRRRRGDTGHCGAPARTTILGSRAPNPGGGFPHEAYQGPARVMIWLQQALIREPWLS